MSSDESSHKYEGEEGVVRRKETRLEQDRRLLSFVERRTKACFFEAYLSTSARKEARSYDGVVVSAGRERTARFLSLLLRDGRGVRRVKRSLKMYAARENR